MNIFTSEDRESLPDSRLDLAVFGQRLRHLRRGRGMTLAELGERVGRAPSQLSLLENGRREPKLSLIEALAGALSVPAEELMRRQPPSRRAHFGQPLFIKSGCRARFALQILYGEAMRIR